MSIGTVITLGYGTFGSVNFLPTLGYGAYGVQPPTPDENFIRNFSLRNWRKWTREELEEGELPQELRAEADQAIREATQAAAELAAGRVEAENALGVAMQAREAYEQVYREAYQEAYVASIVAELWKADMKKLRRRRAAALLLLH